LQKNNGAEHDDLATFATQLEVNMEKSLHCSNFINGRFQPAISGKSIENQAPATGQLIGTLPASGADDVALAVQAAKAAASAWALTTPEYRHDILMRISNGIMARLDELAALESLDSGKPVSVARSVDIPRAALNFKFFATAALHFGSESYEIPGHALSYTLRRPVGIVGCISPWNLPLYLFTWKIAPALASGCVVIGKPSEVTPVTAYKLAEICKEAGLPDGVLNILHGVGAEVGAAMVAHPEIKAISFTGSTRAGAEIARVAAPMFKKLSLELGGKNPTIICADANLEDAISTTARAAFSNQGQICLCGSRIYIERSVYEQVKAGLLEKVAQLRQGDPADPKTQIGAMVSKVHFEKVCGYLDLARAEGGTILCGGAPIQMPAPCNEGWFIAPTLIEGLDNQCRTNQEEIFGPVATLQPFDTLEEAIALANDTPYGLSASVWTQNLDKAHRFADALETGIVWVNTWMLRDLRTPFGGVKQSGVGREGGWDAMRFFTEPKNVTFGR
jgi:aminomuconate-semialdehyde/2-hydroxymuconate-6-semialdehyde dehydrogenase